MRTMINNLSKLIRQQNEYWGLTKTRNIIDAIITLVKSNEFTLVEESATAKYIDFKTYVRQLFAGHSEVETFSYIGKPANTPDMMLAGGDAIEVKCIRTNPMDKFYPIDDIKITEEDTPSGDVLLNNVPPMQFLRRDNPFLTRKCREAERWVVKDVLYVVGVMVQNRIKCLSMVYGRDYCAGNGVYDNFRQDIKNLYERNDDIIVNSDAYRELARIYELDPLGIAGARLYAHWRLRNPWRAFQDIYRRNLKANFSFMCIINEDKLRQLRNFNSLMQLRESCENLKISEVNIRKPDKPDEFRKAALITYEI